MGQPPRAAAAVERSQREAGRQVVWVAEGGAGEETRSPWRSPEDLSESQVLDLESFTVLEFGFVLIVTVPWLFPLEVRKYLTYFLILRKPTVERLQTFRRDFWI